MVIRDGSEVASGALVDFFRRTPVGAGSDFVLDRGPDFGALLRLRGSYRTFVALEGERVVGTASALWDDRVDGGTTVRVGETVDVRVAPDARGSSTTARLLAATVEALEGAGADWITAVIGDRNTVATRLVQGRAGLPRLRPLGRYRSIHIVAVRGPSFGGRDLRVRAAGPADAGTVTDAVQRVRAPLRLSPAEPLDWPDPDGRHRAWIAEDRSGRARGVLVTWDGYDVRRIRVTRYAGWDRLLRAGTMVLAPLGLAAPLPAPGGPVRMWATRALWTDDRTAPTARALLGAALTAAAREGVHVLQLNIPDDDPVVGRLPPWPRSTFTSTLFGARLGQAAGASEADPPSSWSADRFYADLAMV